MFKNNNATKKGKLNMNIDKTMRISDGSPHNNKKLYVTVNTKPSCKLEFLDHLWLPFIGQPQSDVIVFAMISLYIYKIIVT